MKYLKWDQDQNRWTKDIKQKQKTLRKMSITKPLVNRKLNRRHSNLMIMDWFTSSAKYNYNKKKRLQIEFTHAQLRNHFFLVQIKEKKMDSSTSHHLIISRVCYGVNMRGVCKFLSISCDKIVSINLYNFEGINCN